MNKCIQKIVTLVKMTQDTSKMDFSKEGPPVETQSSLGPRDQCGGLKSSVQDRPASAWIT